MKINRFIGFSAALVMLTGMAACNSGAPRPLIEGHIDGGESVELQCAYSFDNDVMNTIYQKVDVDSLGNFVIDPELPDGVDGGDMDIYVEVYRVGDHSQSLVGVHYQKDKTSKVNITYNPADGTASTAFGGDNADLSGFYNVYANAFDIMKYFSVEPETAKTNAEYRALLDTEYAGVQQALASIEDNQARDYYTRLSKSRYDWSKARLIMDAAYDEQKDVMEYPEYVAIVESVDPNDSIAAATNLLGLWLTANTPGKLDFADPDVNYLLAQLALTDSCITNMGNRRMAYNLIPSQYLTYMKPSADDVEVFMAAYAERAKEFPELIEKYQTKAKGIVNVGKGQELPYIPVLEAPDGSSVKLSDLYGKVLYIDIWATWCGPCCREIPYMEKLVERFKGNDRIAFISISVDQDKEAWLGKIKGDNPAWPQYRLSEEENNKFMTALGITGIPRFMIIGADGRFITPDAERPSADNIDEIINNTLK